MSDCTITREREGERTVYRLAGAFDRNGAWEVRDRLDREATRDVLLDFSLVRDFSDLGLAVLAHGFVASGRRALFRGLRQHQVRIFRYCGLAVEEVAGREAAVPAATPAPGALPADAAAHRA